MWCLPNSFSVCSPLLSLSPPKSMWGQIYNLDLTFTCFTFCCEDSQCLNILQKTLLWCRLRIFHDVLALQRLKQFPIFWEYLGGFQISTIGNRMVMGHYIHKYVTHLSLFCVLFSLNPSVTQGRDFCPAPLAILLTASFLCHCTHIHLLK